MKVKYIIIFIFLFILFGNRNTHAASKRIEINTGIQRLYAYEGSKLIYDMVISSGITPWETPHGIYQPWIKISSDRMIGGVSGTSTYYNLPNVPWVVYFYNSAIPKTRGYAIHGTYWHNNFGHPMSHGCINLTIGDAHKIYNWIDLPSNSSTGTRIVIY